ncbi:MAG: hypothetical protein ABIP19_00195 [Dermatophilaceae bacterium]
MTKMPAPPRRPLAAALALAAAAALASCSQSSSVSVPITGPTTASATSTATGQATTPSPTNPSSPTSAGRRIDITVTGKQVSPKPATVNIAVGETLTIAVTSDHDDELHAHAFDIERGVKAGQPLEVTIKGARPGVYEVELHEPELRLFQVAVR